MTTEYVRSMQSILVIRPLLPKILPTSPITPIRSTRPLKHILHPLNLCHRSHDLDIRIVRLRVPLLGEDLRLVQMREAALHGLQHGGRDAVDAVAVAELEELRRLCGADLLLDCGRVLAHGEEEEVVVHEGGFAVVGAAGLGAMVEAG